MAFERDSGEGLEAAGVVLWGDEKGYKIINIVPLKVRELGYRGYNALLQDFAARVARPAAEMAGFKIELTSNRQSLDDWLPVEAATALRQFSVLANKSTGSSHPSDRKRWLAFLIKAHQDKRSFNSDLLMRWLVEVERWPEEVADKLASQYEFGLDLLDQYDQG
jgi:hypothetical protein